MSGQKSPVAPESSKSRAAEDSSSEAKPYTFEDGEQLWKDIQAQTGFDSYREYIRTYLDWEDRSDLDQLWDWIFHEFREDDHNRCYILDVSAHEDWPPRLSTRCHSTSGLQLLAALGQPPEHVRVQIVLWTIGERISLELLDILGLGLRIDPQFFLAVIQTLGARQRSEPFDRVVDTRPLRPSHVVIDRLVATLVHHYPIDKPAAPPIILIAGAIDDGYFSGQLFDLAFVAAQSLNNSPPFTKSALAPTITQSFEQRWLHVYKGTFRAPAVNNPGITSRTAAIIAEVLMPLLQINCLRIRAYFLRLRRTFLTLQAAMFSDSLDHHRINDTMSKLHRERFWLRRSVEDSDDGMIHFERYIAAEDAKYLHESSAYLSIKQETKLIHDEARRLDTEVRDYLQLIVGNLSLEESRKSIELSNNQISEAKRGLWLHD